MEQPSYLIINPLQLVLINEGKNVEKMSEIERQFYKKLRKLKNIDDNLKRVKIKKWLVDV
jgi:hypothetical protein